jgi:CheY-like chemotaxis protein
VLAMAIVHRGIMKTDAVILLAEDDDGHAGLISSNLKYAGVTNDILFFENGKSILDFIFKRGTGPYRKDDVLYILLLDIRMPDMDGIEILRKIKNDKWVRNIPVIMLSVVDDNKQIELCNALGCENYYIKYSDDKEFAQTIGELGNYIKSEVIPKYGSA